MQKLVNLSLSVLYLFAPLIVSSALAGVVLRLGLFEALRKPIDAGKSFRGRRWFGDHKTWLGVVVAIIGCVATVAIQRYGIGDRVHVIALVDYREIDVIWFGTVMGGGAMLGELPNSFAKRQLGIAPGQTARGIRAIAFYAWDQLDILTTWLFLWCWVRPTWLLLLVSSGLALVIHPIVSLLGYLVGARQSAR